MIPTPAALLPANEAERLRTLYHHDILQSLREGVFDELAELAAQLFNLPISYISLTGEHESIYKAAYGFEPLPPQARVDMLCAMAVKQNQVVVYHDLRAAIPTPADAAALAHALTHQAQFHAAAPLRLTEEHSIGALCLVDSQPREFSLAEQQTLDYLAGVVSLTIAVRHVCRNHPALGEARWEVVGAQLREEISALSALVRYLKDRYGRPVPIPGEVLQPVARRLTDLRNLLEAYQYGGLP